MASSQPVLMFQVEQCLWLCFDISLELWALVGAEILDIVRINYHLPQLLLPLRIKKSLSALGKSTGTSHHSLGNTEPIAKDFNLP